MKIFYEHQWGAIEKFWHVSTIVLAEVEKGEEDNALEMGFISDDGEPEYWYNCRSVRVPLKKNARPYHGELKTVISNKPLEGCSEIYKTWCDKKGFTAHEGDDAVFDHDTYIHYFRDEKLIAYSKIRCYEKSAELLLFATLEENMAMESLRYELYWLRSNGFEWAYLGQAYEECSLWKAEQSRVEWWTGKEWSKDKKELKKLCLQDKRNIMYGIDGIQ